MHSTAHHAESALSYLHPHLGQLCASIDRNQIGLDLLTGALAPAPSRIPRTVKLSAQALCQRFGDILRSEHIDDSWLSEAVAEFVFYGATWPDGCIVKVKTVDGREVEAAVRHGQKGKIIRVSLRAD